MLIKSQLKKLYTQCRVWLHLANQDKGNLVVQAISTSSGCKKSKLQSAQTSGWYHKVDRSIFYIVYDPNETISQK